MSEMRATGGNRFIEAGADRAALVAAIDRGLRELEAWVADDPSRIFDPGAISVDTMRIADGRISVSVTGDWIRNDGLSKSTSRAEINQARREARSFDDGSTEHAEPAPTCGSPA